MLDTYNYGRIVRKEFILPRNLDQRIDIIIEEIIEDNRLDKNNIGIYLTVIDSSSGFACFYDYYKKKIKIFRGKENLNYAIAVWIEKQRGIFEFDCVATFATLDLAMETFRKYVEYKLRKRISKNNISCQIQKFPKY